MNSAKELGEKKIIAIIMDCLDKMPNMSIPFGDDASAIEIGPNHLVVVNMDMLVEKTDIPPTMNLFQAARKAVIMNLSDLAAKGAQPIALLASLGIPPELTKVDLQHIGMGLNAGAREYNTYILGGDTNEATELIISCMALGVSKKNKLIKRNGAKPGDFVAVTGSFGKTASGLKILIDKLSAPNICKVLVDSILFPKARINEGIILANSQAITASIDSSDGLAWSLHELSIASNVGFYIENIPIDPAVEIFAQIHGLNSIELALYGGEEYELIVTVKPCSWNKIKKAIESIGSDLIKIGVVTAEKQCLLNLGDKSISISKKGWEHFKAR